MNALFLVEDSSVFLEGSEARARMRAYAAALGTLHVVAPALKGASSVVDGALLVHPLGSRFGAPGRVRALIAHYGIDIVSVHNPFELGWIAAQAVKGTSVKLHVNVHTDFLSPWFLKSGGFRSPQVRVPFVNQLRRRFADRVLPAAHGIRAVSKRVGDSLVEHYGRSIQVPVVIPVAVTGDTPPALPLPVHDFSFALITMGPVEPKKRIEDVLHALGRIRLQYPSVGLFIVGKGSDIPRLKQVARTLGLKDQVVFVEKEHQEAVGLLQSAHAYVQASAYEGYGRHLIEAALVRLPVISTDVGIVGEVFTGYKDILSAPIADPAALAVHIRGLVDDHQARTLLALEAQKTAQEYVRAVGDIPARVATHLSQTLEKA